MASTLNKLAFTFRCCNLRIPPRSTSRLPLPPCRQFNSSCRRRDKASSKPYPSFAATLDPEDRADYEALSPAERAAFEADAKRLEEHMTSRGVEADIASEVANAAHQIALENDPRDSEHQVVRPKRGAYLPMGEVDEYGTGDDPEFAEDDMSSTAHGELEQHREIREYARLAAWEMPLLSKLAKPFVPPAQDQPLRFRYTSYMGEQHPAENKVVLEFCPKDMPDLTEAQRTKLVKLVGVRYNPETEIVKMSSEQFETQAQNKRYLGDLVDTLLAEAKDSSDMFEDIPLDFRHHKFKHKPRFPEHWQMTPERKRQLDATRRQRLQADRERAEQGKLIDGVKLIQRALKSPAYNAAPATVEAQRGTHGKGRSKGERQRLLR
ncbi:MAG: 37S ribosomal protein S24, mitochondrial [Candelina submexicana]|nr:MAG: 37S ribosomal protein S24, mitochondrial [Candelina submexicana]